MVGWLVLLFRKPSGSGTGTPGGIFARRDAGRAFGAAGRPRVFPRSAPGRGP